LAFWSQPGMQANEMRCCSASSRTARTHFVPGQGLGQFMDDTSVNFSRMLPRCGGYTSARLMLLVHTEMILRHH
jgi:hypothetical protein